MHLSLTSFGNLQARSAIGALKAAAQRRLSRKPQQRNPEESALKMFRIWSAKVHKKAKDGDVEGRTGGDDNDPRNEDDNDDEHAKHDATSDRRGDLLHPMDCWRISRQKAEAERSGAVEAANIEDVKESDVEAEGDANGKEAMKETKEDCVVDVEDKLPTLDSGEIADDGTVNADQNKTDKSQSTDFAKSDSNANLDASYKKDEDSPNARQTGKRTGARRGNKSGEPVQRQRTHLNAAPDSKMADSRRTRADKASKVAWGSRPTTGRTSDVNGRRGLRRKPSAAITAKLESRLREPRRPQSAFTTRFPGMVLECEDQDQNSPPGESEVNSNSTESSAVHVNPGN